LKRLKHFFQCYIQANIELEKNIFDEFIQIWVLLKRAHQAELIHAFITEIDQILRWYIILLYIFYAEFKSFYRSGLTLLVLKILLALKHLKYMVKE
jgi:hypothetical protein